MNRVLHTYLLAQVPGWLLTAIVLWALYHWRLLTPGFAIGLLLVWILKDALLYPVMRRYYESESPSGRMVGEHAVVVTPLAPDGLVRIRGELWQARSDVHVPVGATVRVQAVEGLTLTVAAQPTPGP